MIFTPQSPNRVRLFTTGIGDRWKNLGALFNCLPGFLLALLLLSPISAIAQSTSAALSGTVADSTGAVIPNAKIVLRNTDTGAEQTTSTGGAGTYSITNILPGIYSINVTKSGFKATQRDRFTLLVNQTLSLNFTLPIGSEQQTVTITGDVSTVQSTTAELGTVITTRSVSDLPLNGRNFTQLLTLTPGVSPVSVGQNRSGGGFAGNAIGTFTFPSVNGQRNRSNMFLLDGVNDLGFLGNYNYSPIVDSIQEFKVQSHNDLAEFGQVTGGIINVATKGGSNNFHGSLWEFVRNEQLDARSYFAEKRNPLRQNQFGGTVGGPVRVPHVYNGKEKTFFFFGYEGFRQRLLSQSPVISPTAAELGGDFSSLLSAPNLVSKTPVQLYNPYSTRPDPVQSGKFIRDPFPGNIIPQGLLNRAAVLYASTLFPSPSGSAIAGGNVIDNTRTQVDENNYTGRIDQNFGEHDILFGRVSYLHEPSSASAGFPGALTSTDITSWNFALHESHVFSPTAILETHFGRNLGNDVIAKGFPNAPANFGASLVAAGMSSNFLSSFQALPGTLTPLISIAGYASTSGSNIQGTQIADTYQYGADFTKILGRHTFKIGGEYSTTAFNGPIAVTVEGTSAFQTANLEATTGATTGDSLASFLLGVPASASRRDVTETEHGGSIDGVYLQDQIKVNPKLSLNVGVRYDVTIWPGYGSLSNGQGYVGDMNLSNGTYIVTAIPPACSTTVGAPCIPGGSPPSKRGRESKWNKQHSQHRLRQHSGALWFCLRSSYNNLSAWWV